MALAGGPFKLVHAAGRQAPPDEVNDTRSLLRLRGAGVYLPSGVWSLQLPSPLHPLRIKMHILLSLLLVFGLDIVDAHGGHGEGPAAGETIQQYAQRHMSSEHHIDAFDVGSFFALHDLNRDGVWDREEIEAVYGVHHVYSQKKSKDEIEHQKKADHIVNTVLAALDKDGNGKITLEELKAVGLDGLPNFESLGAEGHHYDIESEFFLHHEEQFHGTPETQTDESYNHPEDLEHFAHHESIERVEAEREAKFQGITVDEALAQHEPHEHDEPKAPAQHPADGEQQVIQHPHDDQHVGESPVVEPPTPKFTRTSPVDPVEKLQKAAKAASGNAEEWGSGDGGYKPPKNPSDRMRKNLPYKYKFRRTWGDF
ncbi:unnamed protein product [Somion occarium]|uniref:EF-hand domain-containing protein n=1 Tax=Somion occarium TaxID=3059160 RepID=A0ABP1CI27_9APHY